MEKLYFAEAHTDAYNIDSDRLKIIRAANRFVFGIAALFYLLNSSV